MMHKKIVTLVVEGNGKLGDEDRARKEMSH